MINTDECIKYLYENHVGRENAISGCDLGDEFGLLDPQIRMVVNHARCSGIPICSSSKGYYYSEDPAEISATINSLYHRIESVIHAIDGLEKVLKSELTKAANEQRPV